MIPGKFEYQLARDLPHAFQLLAQGAGEAKLLAGGQSLIPLMKFRLAEPHTLIDLNRIEGLAYVKENGDLRIGALTREVELETSAVIRARYPILTDTAAVIADPIVRNLATVGGNLAHADPANDHPATMLALRARVVARSATGERVIPIDELFVDTFQTSLRPDEILTEIRIPKPLPKSGGVYLKLERKVGDFAIAGVAVYLVLDDRGAVKTAGIGLTNVGSTALRAKKAEAALVGNMPDDKTIVAAALAASGESQPTGDLRGPAEYKRDVVRVLTGRAVRHAVARAKGGA